VIPLITSAPSNITARAANSQSVWRAIARMAEKFSGCSASHCQNQVEVE
jgi:hypothetical protein